MPRYSCQERYYNNGDDEFFASSEQGGEVSPAEEEANVLPPYVLGQSMVVPGFTGEAWEEISPGVYQQITGQHL